MVQQSAEDSLRLARAHLARVQAASWDPTDWADLSSYGLYCLEACIVAAALHLGQPRPRSHFAKAETAESLSLEHGLPDIGDLLIDLNNMRKHQAYGDTPAPVGMDPEDTASMIETYVDLVQGLLAQ
ncbi:MAG: hypothetical protein F4X83_02450 [Chloroflexi bacterium]|nr:hypothetical protein [Chloroflexota bacterium]